MRSAEGEPSGVTRIGISGRITREELGSMDLGFVSLGNTELATLMLFALEKIPAEEARWILENCLLACPVGASGGQYLAADLINKRALLIFPEAMLELVPEAQIEMLLHECAHARLVHAWGADWELYDRQEQEAWELVEDWLGYAPRTMPKS